MRTRVAHVDDIPPEKTLRVAVNGVEVLLCNTGERIYAVEDVCTHDGAPLDQGNLEGACIVCPRHGATFDVRTGEALTLPAFLPLPTFDVTIDNGDVFVDV